MANTTWNKNSPAQQYVFWMWFYQVIQTICFDFSPNFWLFCSSEYTGIALCALEKFPDWPGTKKHVALQGNYKDFAFILDRELNKFHLGMITEN